MAHVERRHQVAPLVERGRRRGPASRRRPARRGSRRPRAARRRRCRGRCRRCRSRARSGRTRSSPTTRVRSQAGPSVVPSVSDRARQPLERRDDRVCACPTWVSQPSDREGGDPRLRGQPLAGEARDRIASRRGPSAAPSSALSSSAAAPAQEQRIVAIEPLEQRRARRCEAGACAPGDQARVGAAPRRSSMLSPPDRQARSRPRARDQRQRAVQPAVADSGQARQPRPPRAGPARRNGCACRGRASPRPGRRASSPAATTASAARAPDAGRSGRRARQSPHRRPSRGRSAASAGSPSGGNAASPSIAPRRTITTSRFSPGAAASATGVTSGGPRRSRRRRARGPAAPGGRAPVRRHRRLNSGEASTSAIPSQRSAAAAGRRSGSRRRARSPSASSTKSRGSTCRRQRRAEPRAPSRCAR